jgi:hypothetical protein
MLSISCWNSRGSKVPICETYLRGRKCIGVFHKVLLFSVEEQRKVSEDKGHYIQLLVEVKECGRCEGIHKEFNEFIVARTFGILVS